MSNQAAIAKAFRARHNAGPVLFMPNAWDALSARIFADAGYEALATTSGGVARITVGTASTLVAMEAIRNLARGLGQPGGFELLSVPFTHGDGQALFQGAGE